MAIEVVIFIFKMIASFDIGEKNLAFCVGTIDSLDRFSFNNVIKSQKQTIIESCNFISEILAKENWNDCVKVIIENQMRQNVRAQRVSQHVWTWFKLTCPHLDPEFVSSSLKTRWFLGKNDLSSKARKKWAIAKFSELLTRVGSEKIKQDFHSLKKKDDVADAYLQLVAWGNK